ncbi:MAG: hypothetical protein K8U57_30560 [Planctomycetes bacterium]|nr:hypothetical protein [Planctomycetota bacterium]
MAYELLRIFYSIWLLGAVIFTFNAVSSLIFSDDLDGKRLKALLATPIFCAVWPLSLFSSPGRKVLLGKFNQL